MGYKMKIKVKRSNMQMTCMASEHLLPRVGCRFEWTARHGKDGSQWSWMMDRPMGGQR